MINTTLIELLELKQELLDVKKRLHLSGEHEEAFQIQSEVINIEGHINTLTEEMEVV
jgi:hypothetical protein